MRIGIVIPAFEEEASVGVVVSRCRELKKRYPDLRVVVADNGSKDATAHRARRAGAEVVTVRSRGYGAACLGAVRHFGNWPDMVVFIDADGSSLPEEVPLLIEPIAISSADLVLGRRRNEVAMTLPQRWGTRLAVFLVNLRWRTGYTDMGPFRAIRADCLRQMQMRDRTWGWTVEMQILAVRMGLRVLEVDTSWLDRIAGVSKISGTVSGVVRAGARILWTVGRYAVKL